MVDASCLTKNECNKIITDFIDFAPTKVEKLIQKWGYADKAPVHTWKGCYRDRPWTDWTRGFLYGSALLCYEMTGNTNLRDMVLKPIQKYMPVHLTHMGVHDHGFNNVSTYGNALRFLKKGLAYPEESTTLQLALRVSGTVQAMRFTPLPEQLGYVYSFNGVHSLFADTIRSMRSLALAHQLGHYLLGENEKKINLLSRLLCHAETTARFIVFHGTGRDVYDIAGRVAHEGIFNVADGQFRAPATQQGFSAFSTWTRALAWIMLGFTELAEFIDALVTEEEVAEIALPYFPNKDAIIKRFLHVVSITCDYYIENTMPCGIPFWDTAAPNLPSDQSWKHKDWEPNTAPEALDSSAAVIAAQAFYRMGTNSLCIEKKELYESVSKRIVATLFSEPYLNSNNEKHEGLILHAVYHIPNGWDHHPLDAAAPCGESTMWGDYHALELALTIQQQLNGTPYHFYNI